MKKQKKVLSFRFKDHILEKIDYLIQQDARKTEELGVKPRTRTQIIENAIQDYYLRQIDGDRDPDIVERISRMVSDAADVRFGSIKRIVDEILFYAIKNDLGNKVFYEYSDEMPDPGSIQKALSMIAEKDTVWDDSLNEYLRQRWGRIVADINYSRRPDK
ncbi:MAG: hypothetical protein IKS54_03560 [Erysipelotrichaceae bacterium]|nr:hypothetical protein [Erysipelotrichaceae bacterium]